MHSFLCHCRDVGFWLKKLVSSLVMPLPVALALIALGLFWARRERTRTRGVRTALAGAGILYIASLPPFAFMMLAPLEDGMVAYQAPDEPPAAIVVLGAGYHPVANRPLTGVISSGSVTRVAEALRIARMHPKTRVHCSGWGGPWPGSNAAAACQLAVGMGLAPTRVVLHPSAKDTEEEAIAVAATKPTGKVVVVTHATHMLRARELFERHGLDVVPAPTGHISPESPTWTLIPASEALGTTTGSWREWLGRLWIRIKPN